MIMQEQSIPFELHITTEDISLTEIQGFVTFCSRNEAKPLLIELAQGECIKQPMFSKVLTLRTLEEALGQATALSRQLHANYFGVKRLKIEVPSSYSELWASPPARFTPYFEWHGKIAFDKVGALHKLCRKHRAHLSLNALKDNEGVRFITLREHGDKNLFEQRVQELVEALESGGWPLIKQQSEYCLYDNNICLDKGWLPQ